MPEQPHAGPAKDARSLDDQRLELAIANLLRIGVLAAAALVLCGGILAMRHAGAPVRSYATFYPPGDPHSSGLGSIAHILHEAGRRSGAGIIGLGLLVLIATPIARVLFAILGFARERDWLYTAISLVVFAILVFSLLHGR